MNDRRQRGVALVMALLIVAIATIIAVAVSTRAEIESRRTETLLHGGQALQYVLGAEDWVKQILRRDLEAGMGDHLGEAWAMQLPPLPVEGGLVTGRIEDMNARFNLGNLVGSDGQSDAASVRQLRRLIAALGLTDRVPLDAIVDWIDGDQQVTLPEGAEDFHYLGLESPYRTPDRRLAATSELLLVRGIEREVFEALSPYLVALPVRTTTNVNTASEPVLMSLAEGITPVTARTLIEARAGEGFESIQHFRGLLDGPPDSGILTGLTSDHFRLTVQVRIGSVDVTLYSLLERAANGRTRVIARSRAPI